MSNFTSAWVQYMQNGRLGILNTGMLVMQFLSSKVVFHTQRKKTVDENMDGVVEYSE